MAKQKPAHYRGTYHVHSRWVRVQANANPNTRCWRCHRTLFEAQAAHGPHVRWTAGHLVDGQAGGKLAAECSHCNYGEPGRKRHRAKQPERRTDLTW